MKHRNRTLQERYAKPLSVDRIIRESIQRALLGEGHKVTENQRRLIEMSLEGTEKPKTKSSSIPMLAPFNAEGVDDERGYSIVLDILEEEKRKTG